MNREQALRTAVYQKLSGASIPYYDSKDESSEPIYGIISSQFSVRTGNQSMQQYNCTIDIDIFHKQQNSATYDLVDEFGEEAENLLCPEQVVPGDVILPQQPSWIIHHGWLNSASNIKLRTTAGGGGLLVNKTMQFTFLLTKI